ncbi:tripartite tricarboxylate transporter TctB family protein [Breznakiella homolactica]|uniref:Tripartite tricarboxylate transporter TctB family protein n=1 Tax=Breznakiella homolactica TaxID=2798577 RepID=A0A7T8B8E7_9SPIR|nr:tripartite tricarboxylate transporter TctB family protein [Breznakiella homolactica]QQO08509.1 tripartite tricarboxylate transporter TctB family protein [Breznakiella homolactica]
MLVKRDQITGAVLVLVGVFFFILVNQFSVDIRPDYPGPKMFPLISVFGFIICGTGIFLQSTLSKKEEKKFVLKEGWIRIGISFGLLILYVFIMKYLGYLITTPFVLFALCTVYSKGFVSKLVPRIIFAIAFTLISYVIYVYAFGLRMPGGVLF